MRIIKVLSIVVLALTFFSCEPTYEKEYSWAFPLSGDWKVNAFVDGNEVGGPYEIKIYNSSLDKIQFGSMIMQQLLQMVIFGL